MSVLRFFIFHIICWGATLLWAPTVFLVWPFGAQYSYAVAESWTKLVAFFAKHICGLTYRVEGTENFPDENCVVFLKHSSAFETYITCGHQKTMTLIFM